MIELLAYTREHVGASETEVRAFKPSRRGLLRQLIRNFIRIEYLAQHFSHRAHIYGNRAID